MSKVIAIAVDHPRRMFAAEDEATGFCGVFLVASGPVIEPGDILDGDSSASGECRFLHARGACEAKALSGPISRPKAVMLVNEFSGDWTGL